MGLVEVGVEVDVDALLVVVMLEVEVDVDALLVVVMLEVEVVELDEVVGATMQLQALDIL